MMLDSGIGEMRDQISFLKKMMDREWQRCFKHRFFRHLHILSGL